MINAALASVGNGTDSNFTSDSIDPVGVLDAQILNVIKAARYGSLMSVGVLFGATACAEKPEAPAPKDAGGEKADAGKDSAPAVSAAKPSKTDPPHS